MKQANPEKVIRAKTAEDLGRALGLSAAETGNLKLVQGLLRHAQLSTTADTYVHNLPESDRQVAQILERQILGSCSQLFPVVPKLGDKHVQ